MGHISVPLYLLERQVPADQIHMDWNTLRPTKIPLSRLLTQLLVKNSSECFARSIGGLESLISVLERLADDTTVEIKKEVEAIVSGQALL